MFLKDFEYQGTQHSVVDKYMIIYRGDHVLFHKQGAEKNSWNKKGYQVTYNSCTCPAGAYRRNQKCRHIKILEGLNWKLKEKEPKEIVLTLPKKMQQEVNRQWRECYKKENITDKKEQKWMRKNFQTLSDKYHCKSVTEMHKVWIDTKQGTELC